MRDARHHEPNGRQFLHADCGTPLDDRGDCTLGGLTPEPGDVVTAPRRGQRSRREDAVALRRPHRLPQPIAAT